MENKLEIKKINDFLKRKGIVAVEFLQNTKASDYFVLVDFRFFIVVPTLI